MLYKQTSQSYLIGEEQLYKTKCLYYETHNIGSILGGKVIFKFHLSTV